MSRRHSRGLAPLLVVALSLSVGSATVPLGVITAASAAPLGVSRIGGADRYEVSAAISADTYPAGTPRVAYVVSGENFPDALSASALAGLQGGPVLLTRKASLPEAIRTELSRLHPLRIVVLGGIAAIGDEVVDDLERFSPTITRIGGADRYEVSAAASRVVFAPGTPVPTVPRLFIASGEGFPDALSGGPAGIYAGGPVLLVSKDSIPAAVKAELLRIRPAEIFVLGGTAAIAQTVVDELKRDVQSGTYRVDGADRYEVSARTATYFPNGRTSTVFIASGANYPDALSGGAAAVGGNLGPLLLVEKDSIPSAVATQLTRLAPTRIVVLGGRNAVSEGVETALASYLHR